MIFDLNDYHKNLASGFYSPPNYYQPFINVCKSKYSRLEKLHEKYCCSLNETFSELQKRIDDDYFSKSYRAQSTVLYYSKIAFPAYKFLLPEIIANDWNAAVGWHKFNRDHVLHQPLTAYVVQKLLNGGGDEKKAMKIGNNLPLLDYCIDNILKFEETKYLKDHLLSVGLKEDGPWLNGGSTSKFLWKCLFLETAYLAAVFHDMGYPWQYVDVLNNKLEQVGYKSETPVNYANAVIDDFGERLVFCPFYDYRLKCTNRPVTWIQELQATVSGSLRKTHGLPGAIGFLYLNDVLRQYPDNQLHPIRQFCIEWAAMAIMMHDMGKIYWGNSSSSPENPHLRLNFRRDPLSCVIALADVLEDFSRPIAEFKKENGCIGISYGPGSVGTELNMDHGTLTITYLFSNHGKRAKKEEYMPNEHREYFDRRNGFLDLSPIGINNVVMKTILSTK